MKTASKTRNLPTLAARVHGEDINRGDFLALLSQTVDVPSYFWDCSGLTLDPQEMVRLRLIPGDAGLPMKVVAVCLPFVYAKTPFGAVQTIDTRCMDLVRLDRHCAKQVWKEMRGKH